jgi:hypothetical protein
MSPAVIAIRNTDSARALWLAVADALTTAITPMAADREIFNERSIALHLADACVAEAGSEGTLPDLNALMTLMQLACPQHHASPRGHMKPLGCA